MVELEGDLAGVIAWFPVDEGDERARRFVALTAPRVPPWHWPRLLRHLRAAGHGLPQPAARARSTSTRSPSRRRSAAAAWRRALLGRRRASAAAAAGSSGVALDTGLHNEPARALYERVGFRQREIRRAPSPRVARGDRRPGVRRLLQAAVSSASATCATWPSVMRGKNGSAIERAATSSQTGNSPSRWPKRSR